MNKICLIAGLLGILSGCDRPEADQSVYMRTQEKKAQVEQSLDESLERHNQKLMDANNREE